MPTLDETLAQMQPDDTADAVDFDNYQDAAEFPPPVPRGEYTMIQEKPDFDVRDKVHLIVTVHHKISGGDYDGRRIMYDRLSTKTFDRDGTRASTAADHIRALGFTEHPRGAREWGEALLRGEGKPWKGILDWEASCLDCIKEFQAVSADNTLTKEQRKKCTITGERNFPANMATGGRMSKVPCPNCQREIEARNRIVRRIPA